MKKTFSLITLALLSACSTTKFEADRAKAVKNAAIVGLEIESDEPPKMSLEVSFGASDSEVDRMPKAGIAHDTPAAGKIYDVLRSRVGQRLKWNFVEREAVARDPAYRAAYDKTMKGWRSRPQIGAKSELYSAPGIMDYWAAEKDAEIRAQLCRALKVDALLLANYRVRAVRTESVLGAAVKGKGLGAKPQASMSLKAYACRDGEVIWSEAMAQGDPTQESGAVIATEGKDLEKFQSLSVEASHSAIEAALTKALTPAK